MSVLSRRRLRKQLHQVLEDWISEELGDSSEDDEKNFSRDRHTRTAMESKFLDQSSTSANSARASSRISSTSSASTENLPPPPKYESVIQRPVNDYSSSSSGTEKQSRWEKEINQIVGDFDKNCTTKDRPTQKQLSSGAQSYIHEETTSRRSVSPTMSNSGLDRNFDWDRNLLADDNFFRDSPFRQKHFADRPFGNIRSRFGDDIDRFFGRGTFSTDWDTFFPEITFSDFGGSSQTLRNRAISGDTHPIDHEEEFKLEVDVQGFEPHELLVKTVGHNLLVLAKTEGSNGDDTGTNRKREFRELRKEFTIPPHINPTDISSNLTPNGMLVIEAPARNAVAMQSRDD